MTELITYDTIRKSHRAEKQEIALQKLPENLFILVRNWIDHKQSMQKSTASLLEIENAKKLLDDLLNRREKKLVISALHTIRGDLPPQNMTLDEEKFFDNLVCILKQARQDMREQMFGYDSIIEEKIESARTMMEEMKANESVPAFLQKKTDNAKNDIVINEKPSEDGKENPTNTADVKTEMKSTDNEIKSAENVVGPAIVQSNITKLKITRDMPSFVDAEMKTYGPFKAGMTAELPNDMAQILIARKVAEVAGSL